MKSNKEKQSDTSR